MAPSPEPGNYPVRARPRSTTRVRPYALTAGRTEPSVDLPWEAIIETLPFAPHDSWPFGDIRADILHLGELRPSIVEVAMQLQRPVGAVRVVVGDLVLAGTLRVHATLSESASFGERRALMKRTLRGLKGDGP